MRNRTSRDPDPGAAERSRDKVASCSFSSGLHTARMHKLERSFTKSLAMEECKAMMQQLRKSAISGRWNLSNPSSVPAVMSILRRTHVCCILCRSSHSVGIWSDRITAPELADVALTENGASP